MALIPVRNAFLITNPEQQRHINETLSETRFHSRNNVIDISILLDRMTELKQAIASYVSCSPRRQWNARKAKRSQSPRGRGQGRKSKRYAGVYKRTYPVLIFLSFSRSISAVFRSRSLITARDRKISIRTNRYLKC